MLAPPATRLVPYRQEAEPPHRAAIVRVETGLEGLSDDELQVLGHLIEAADLINPVFRHQCDARTSGLRRLVLQLIETAEGPVLQKLEDYRAILELQNAPFASIPPKNHLLDVSPEDLHLLARLAGPSVEHDLHAYLDLLTRGETPSDKANFYPPDLTDAEFDSLGAARSLPNSSVVRDSDRNPAGRPERGALSRRPAAGAGPPAGGA